MVCGRSKPLLLMQQATRTSAGARRGPVPPGRGDVLPCLPLQRLRAQAAVVLLVQGGRQHVLGARNEQGITILPLSTLSLPLSSTELDCRGGARGGGGLRGAGRVSRIIGGIAAHLEALATAELLHALAWRRQARRHRESPSTPLALEESREGMERHERSSELKGNRPWHMPALSDYNDRAPIKQEGPGRQAKHCPSRRQKRHGIIKWTGTSNAEPGRAARAHTLTTCGA